MPGLCHLDGIRVWMDYMGHNPPHIHASYGEHEITILIRDTRVTRGSLPRSKERILIEWIHDRQQELLTRWDLAHNGREFGPMEP